MTFEKGYRRPPPVSGQFKKGQSGNPKGRPKGVRNFLTEIEQQLNQPVMVTLNGKKTRVTRLQAISMRLVNRAMEGDLKAIATLVEMMRRNGKLAPGEAENLLPPNHEEILAAFVDWQQGGSTASTPSDRSTKPKGVSNE